VKFYVEKNFRVRLNRLTHKRCARRRKKLQADFERADFAAQFRDDASRFGGSGNVKRDDYFFFVHFFYLIA
jgi:hypothetical protein